MKKMISLLLLTLFAASLTACAPMSKQGQEETRVKCPACGYEFQAPYEQ